MGKGLIDAVLSDQVCRSGNDRDKRRAGKPHGQRDEYGESEHRGSVTCGLGIVKPMGKIFFKAAVRGNERAPARPRARAPARA